MATATQINATLANNDAQVLATLALKVSNDATKLLGNIATTQTSINSSTGLYQAPNMGGIDDQINSLIATLQFVDNQILILQQASIIPS